MSNTQTPARTDGNGQPPAKRSAKDEIKSGLERMSADLETMLPQHVTRERFEKTVMTAITRSGDLLNAERKSLFNAVADCARDGLMPDGQEAVLTVFNDKQRGKVVQYMPMVRGIIKKLRNSGQLSTINAHVVYENDEFDYRLGDDEHIHHRPHLGNNPGKAYAVYAVAHLKDGSIDREVMPIREVNKIMQVSPSKNARSGPWQNWWDEMARKSAIRRLSKRLPADTERAFEHDRTLPDYSATAGQEAVTSQDRGSRAAQLTAAARGEPAAPEAQTIDAETVETPQSDQPVETLALVAPGNRTVAEHADVDALVADLRQRLQADPTAAETWMSLNSEVIEHHQPDALPALHEEATKLARGDDGETADQSGEEAML